MFAHHHRRAHRRRGRRPDAVRRLRGVHRPLVGRRLRTAGPLGVLARRAGWPASACSTSRAAPSSRSTAAPPDWRSPWSSASGWAGRVRRCPRTRCRSRCSGAGLLWFGWFGFNAGSALHADGLAVNALVATHLPASAGCSPGSRSSADETGSATTLGGASGAIAGLVAITPACGFLAAPAGAGPRRDSRCASACSAVQLKYQLGYDDSLDVVGVHFVGGVIGMLFLGLAAVADRQPRGRPRGPALRRWRCGCSAGRRSLSSPPRAFAFSVTFLLASRAQQGDAAARLARSTSTPGSTRLCTPSRPTTSVQCGRWEGSSR